MNSLQKTLTKEDYRTILIDSFNSENVSISDYLFSKYLLHREFNTEFKKNIENQVLEVISSINAILNNTKEVQNSEKFSDIEVIISPNTISSDIVNSVNFSSSNKNYIVSINKIKEAYTQLIVLIDKHQGSNSFNKLKWVGTKVQFVYLLHILKKNSLISNTYESLAQFLIDNTEIFAESKKQTIIDDLKNGTFPKTGVNIDEVLNEVKKTK